MFGLGPGIGAGEVIVILVVALVVVGPKDLPGLLRRIGSFVGKMRAMATDFRASFDEMARQSELDELRREVQALKGGGAYMDKFTEPSQSVFSDIDAELKKPPAAARPFAPAETDAERGGEPAESTFVDDYESRGDVGTGRPGDPTRLAARRPFAPAEPTPNEVASAASEQEAVAVEPSAARPFAPVGEPERREA